ncbi:MAG: N-acetyl-D-Glu racemase DgcA [Pseudomonadota bacterium]
MRQLTARAETFPIAGSFRISREERTEAHVVVVEILEDGHVGRGECVPYPRYGESVNGVLAQIDAISDAICGGLSVGGLQSAMSAGAARCAVDCALIDLEAKLTGQPVALALGLTPKPLTTAFTISVGEPQAMAAASAAAVGKGHTLLKVKLGLGADDDARIKAVRAAAPTATIIVDANEGWADANLLKNMSVCAEAGVALIEQPLPAGRDGVLATLSHPVPICADESAHTSDGVGELRPRYDAVNVKLNKAGGLTEAMKMVAAARAAELKVMVGCMLGTSLAMAPAIFAAQDADFVDLDGPLLLAVDRNPALVYQAKTVHPPEPSLWG